MLSPLNKIKNVRKIAYATIFALLLLGTWLALPKIISYGIDVSAANDGNVTITRGAQIPYGDENYYGEGQSWYTYFYVASTSDTSASSTGEHVAFCANPGKASIAGSFTTQLYDSISNVRQIKLLIYLNTALDGSAGASAREELFSGIASSLELRYAYTHASIGYLYANDTTGLSSDIRTYITTTIPQRLLQLIVTNSEAWQEAQDFELWGVNESQIASDQQNIFWIEKAESSEPEEPDEPTYYGNIAVRKYDSVTRSSTPQGDATLSGIIFRVYNYNSYDITYKGNIIAPNSSLGEDFTTNSNGEVTISNLPGGSYIVEEYKTNYGYELPSEEESYQIVTIESSNQTKTVTFYNDVRKSLVAIKKRDWEIYESEKDEYQYKDDYIVIYDSICKPVGGASFAGITFEVYNQSANPIYYKGNRIDPGQLVDSVTATSTECEFTLEDSVPYGTYSLREIGSASGYQLISGSHPFDTKEYESGGTIKDSKLYIAYVPNVVYRGDVGFIKVNKNTGESMANIPFRITSKTTGESHIVMTDADGFINTSTVKHSKNTNCYDSIANFDGVEYQECGTWFGLDAKGNQLPVLDNRSALPYDTYEITEISCAQNSTCVDISSSTKTFSIVSNGQAVDLGTWENDCNSGTIEYSIETNATDSSDGDKTIIADGTVTIKDEITYCLEAGKTYTIKGQLMNQSTGSAIKVNSSAIEQTMTITPNSDCGSTNMLFTFDATGLDNLDIVVFESVYQNSELIVSHTDINDAAQTIHVNEKPVIPTGQLTISKNDKETGECVALGSANLEGTTFEIRDSSNNLITTKQLVTNSCSVTVTDLPYGTYTITETKAGTGYVLDPTPRTATINGSATSPTVVFSNQVMRGDVKFTKKDKNTDSIMANIPFRITSKTTNESHIVVTDGDGIVNTSASTALHSNHTNGYDSANIKNIQNQGYGVWFGLNANKSQVSVNDALGALPYDTYEITELSCDNNHFCIDIESSKKTFSIASNTSLVVLEDWENDCLTFSVGTTAVDATDQDKKITAEPKAKIEDIIKYCLQTGKEFTIKGVLMDKSTGEKLLIDGKSVEQTITFTPTSNCGSVKMSFEFDATNLGGTEIVVFEYVYYENELILSHTDINDAAQTVQIVNPEEPEEPEGPEPKPEIPDTGLATGISGSGQGQISLVNIVVTTVAFAGTYLIIRFIRYKRINFRK